MSKIIRTALNEIVKSLVENGRKEVADHIQKNVKCDEVTEFFTDIVGQEFRYVISINTNTNNLIAGVYGESEEYFYVYESDNHALKTTVIKNGSVQLSTKIQ